jgi:hypothetical protein
MKKVKNSTLKLILGLEVVLILLVVAGLVATFFYFRQVLEPVLVAEPTPTFAVTPTVFSVADDTPAETSAISEFTPTVPNEILSTPIIPSATQVFIAEQDFSFSNAETTLPDDVLHEIFYYGGGGGDFGDCFAYGITDLQIIGLSEPILWPEGITWIGCGWKKGENITITTIQPDLVKLVEEISVPFDLETIFYSLPPSLSRPVGRYVFIVEGESGRVEDSVEVVLPTTPSLYSMPENHIALFGFHPEENIRLFVYEFAKSYLAFDADALITRLNLVAWEEFKVNQQGILFINLSMANPYSYTYYVIGTESGYVANSTIRQNRIQNKSNRITMPYCGGLQSRLNTGMQARVAFTNGARMNIRSEPGFGSDVVGQVNEGTIVYLLDRFCADTSTWWRVGVVDKTPGWMTEEQNGVYLLEPRP